MNDIIKLDRRYLLKTGIALGGGLVLAWYLPFSDQAGAAEPAGQYLRRMPFCASTPMDR